MGLGALVKPPPPAVGGPTVARANDAAPSTPVATASAKTTAPDPRATTAHGFSNPNKIAACLAPLGFETGKLQSLKIARKEYPLGIWQALSAKQLFHGECGDVILFVSGASNTLANVVELEANARVNGWTTARSELLQALPVLLKHLQLPKAAELLQMIEQDVGDRVVEAEFDIGSAKAHYISRTVAELRSVCVRLTRQ